MIHTIGESRNYGRHVFPNHDMLHRNIRHRPVIATQVSGQMSCMYEPIVPVRVMDSTLGAYTGERSKGALHLSID
jgi:hypothetical protein